MIIPDREKKKYKDKLNNITSAPEQEEEFNPELDQNLKDFVKGLGIDVSFMETKADTPQQTQTQEESNSPTPQDGGQSDNLLQNKEQTPQETQNNSSSLFDNETVKFLESLGFDSQGNDISNTDEYQYNKEYQNMYLSPDRQYDEEYEKDIQDNKKGHYSDLSQKWLESGGAVKYDKFGRPVLDIQKTLENSLQGDSPSPQELFSFLLPGEQGESTQYDVQGAQDFSKRSGKYNIKNVIDTSNLTPEERRELNKNKDMLLEAGIMGQDLTEKQLQGVWEKPEKKQGVLKMLVRGVTSAIDGIYDLLQAIAKNDRAEMGIVDAPFLQNAGENIDISQLLTKTYDKLTGAEAPTTVSDKILQNIGEWLVPFGGIGKGSKILSNLAKSASAGVLTSVVKQTLDWATLSPEEKIKGIKKDTGLRDFIVDIVGGVMGIKGAEKLINKMTTGTKYTAQELEEINKLQKNFVNGTYKKRITDEIRTNLKDNIKQELYKVHSVFDNETGITHLSGKEIGKAQKIFNNATTQRDYQAIDELLTDEIKAPIEKIKDSKFWKKDRQAYEQINRLLQDTETRDLKAGITNDTLAGARQNLKNQIEQAGQQYESKIQEVKDLPVFGQEIINENRQIQSSLLKTDDKNIIKFYDDKLRGAKKVGDLIKIQREINEDIYNATEDSSRYILNNLQENIKNYYSKLAKTKPEYNKILEANKEYSELKTEINKNREVLDKLYGGKDRFRKAENRELTESETAYNAYKRMTPEQQERLQTLAGLEEGNVLQKISKTELKPNQFGEYSDLAIKNAFGNKSDEVIQLSKTLSSPLNAREASKQVLDGYKKGTIDTETFKSFFSSIGEETKNSEIVKFADNIIEEQNLFKQASFYNHLKNGNIKKVVNSIKTAEDVSLLEDIITNFEKTLGEEHPDITALKHYTDVIKEEKVDKIFENYNQIVENFSNRTNLTAEMLDKIADFWSNNSALLSKLKNNKNISENLDNLYNYLQDSKTVLDEIEEIVKIRLKEDKAFARFENFKEQNEKQLKNIGTARQNTLALLGALTGGEHNITGALGGMVANLLWRGVINKIRKNKLKKIETDPEYFAKIIKYNKKQIGLIKNFVSKIIDESALLGTKIAIDMQQEE